MPDLKDFTSKKKEPQRFVIDDDVFVCAPELPAGATMHMVQMAKVEGVERVLMLGELLDLILLPESAELFAARMKDPSKPITDNQLGAIIEWIVEVYSERPTTQLSVLPSGLDATGMSSTDGARHVVSTPSL